MIEFHADDYGMFPAASGRIIESINNGVINGISLMPNGHYLDESMQLLKEECRKPVKLSIHLNIITEKPLSDASELPDLTDEDGNFNVTYGKLLKASILPSMRKRYKKQIKAELSRQMDRILPYLKEQGTVRIDSHRHFHMVPLVFDVIAELIREKDLKVSYIRIIREKPRFYRNLLRFEYFKPVNVVKVLLLDFFSGIDRLRHRELFECGNADFASILFSGHMTYKNLVLILKNIERNRNAFRENIELMIHPGAVLEPEDIAEIIDAEDKVYMASPMRLKELDAVRKLAAGGK